MSASPDSAVITVVSGLPRSGTSLMMQILERGGLPILADGVRTADDDNPRGYYELEAVKATKRDASWVARAPGHAVKVISFLLDSLPDSHRYRVILMRRDIREVLHSQRTMLDRAGQTGSTLPEDQLAAAFTTQLERTIEWIDRHPHVTRLDVDHRALLTDPEPQLDRVASFLGADVDRAAMSGVVDPALYRQRG